jgi:aminoglycoside phosphotransferase (APT) family kinase protein
VLVHGDLRMGNLIVDGDRLAGILDWEMAAPGDPIADLTWCFIPLWEPPGVDEAALVARYEERTGAPVDPARFRWHRVLGYVRLAYYALSGAGAFDGGHSDDLRLAALRLQLPVHLDRLAATLAGESVTT